MRISMCKYLTCGYVNYVCVCICVSIWFVCLHGMYDMYGMYVMYVRYVWDVKYVCVYDMYKLHDVCNI